MTKRFLSLALVLLVLSGCAAFNQDLERTGNNDYFESSTYHVSPGERARVAQLNDAYDAVEAALDKLPSETAMRANTSHYAVDTGAANAYAVALSYYSAVSYTDGMGVTFKAANTNTGASTLNVNGLGAKLITRQDGSALADGDIPANKIVSVRYNSTSDNFEVHGAPAAGAGSMAAQNASSVTITGGSITGITDLAVADGGTGASTAADARTNLGLGTIATQAANNVAITGGAISGITDLPVADGGTGSSTAAGALTNLGLTTIAAEVNQLAGQGAVAADFAKLHAAGATLVDTTTAQNIAGPKVFTDGLAITGGDLTIRPASGVAARINGGTTAETITGIYAGGYTSTNSTALIAVRSKDDATYPGTISLFGTNGTVGAEGLRVKTDGTVNLPVGLEIGGVAVPFLYTTLSLGGDITSGTTYITKTGRTVTMTFPSLGHTSNSFVQSATGIIPAGYRPVVATRTVYFSDGQSNRTVYVSATGQVWFEYNSETTGENFPATVTEAGTISWVSAS